MVSKLRKSPVSSLGAARIGPETLSTGPLGPVATPVALCFLLISCAQPPGSTARGAAAAAELSGKVYLIGGLTPSGDLALVEEYEPRTQIWRTRSPMLDARNGCGVAVLEDRIYIIGGRRGSIVLQSVERYDPGSDSWTECAPMPTGRWLPAVAVVNGKIYAIGGITGTGDSRRTSDAVEVYDPISNTWSRRSSAPISKSGAAAAVMGDEIFLIGGRFVAGPTPNVSASVHVYDPAADTWQTGPALKQGRTSPCAVVFNDRIYVIGGGTIGAATHLTEVYDDSSGDWSSGPNLSQARTLHSCAVLGNTIYAFGGMREFSASGFLSSIETLTPSESPSSAE